MRVLRHSLLGLSVVASALPELAGLESDVARKPDVISLDPTSYKEKTEAAYWGGSSEAQGPFQPLRVKTADLSREKFDRLIQDGRVFVVEDFGQHWPMAQWDCEFFRSDPTFRGAEMNNMYTHGEAPFVAFESDWMAKATSSGAKSEDAPQLAPFYWGIKDVQYDDAHTSATWKQSMLKKVQEHVKLPPYMADQNLKSFHNTPEFWFAAAGAGAKAHMDSHIQATLSIQLAGSKRWRLGIMEERSAPYLAMVFKDGDVYEEGRTWTPTFNLTLEQGEALFFPPGFIHETLNLGSGASSCAASVTFQFSSPMASRMYRRYLPRIRRTADIHEAWLPIAEWAHLGGAVRKGGLPYAKAKQEVMAKKGAGKTFAALDLNKDDVLSLSELGQAFGPVKVQDLLGFHDLDEDGTISLAEFAEVFSFWAGTEHAVLKDTPKKFHKFQLEDMHGDFNIEDLPKKITDECLKRAQKLEASRQVTGAERTEL